ncbi:hypothetical protein FOZ61_009157 [Perkinsus olseni]|uniref:Uncharacterized protein n=1 Tax=Perkinsus olseni TaxID=32597 RepID=A0A7J6L1Z2_PEROL|nr:hypothetical protein FOZ61_009157 [Perkinsus olseni]
MEEVNFRVAGRLHGGRLCLGSVHDPYDSDTGKGPRSSIPARLQTVLSRGLREPIGFGRESSRFESPRVADGPGPGAYIGAVKRRPFGHERLTSDSWSKRGTGSFASKSTRFQRRPYPAVVPEHHERPASAGYRASSTTLGDLSQKRLQCKARTDWSGYLQGFGLCRPSREFGEYRNPVVLRWIIHSQLIMTIATATHRHILGEYTAMLSSSVDNRATTSFLSSPVQRSIFPVASGAPGPAYYHPHG